VLLVHAPLHRFLHTVDVLLLPPVVGSLVLDIPVPFWILLVALPLTMLCFGPSSHLPSNAVCCSLRSTGKVTSFQYNWVNGVLRRKALAAYMATKLADINPVASALLRGFESRYPGQHVPAEKYCAIDFEVQTLMMA
jgi:hypothetical protein